MHIQEYRNRQTIKKQGSYRIMCLGESTTQNQYPAYLEAILNQSNLNIKFSVIDKGVAGIRTTEILSNLETDLDAYQPDMVVAMMGINDDGKHMPYDSSAVSGSEPILKSFKIYKLAKLLWLRIVNKSKEMRSFALKSGKLKSQEPLNGVLGNQPKKPAEAGLPNNFEYSPTGYLYRDKERSAELEQLCKRNIELKPNDPGAYIQLGWFYDDRLKHSEAEELFKKAVKINPYQDAAYLQLGSFYRRRERFFEAEQALKKALAINPSNSDTLDELGLLYSHQKRFAEAEALFNKAVDLNPDSELFCGRLALIYSESGDTERFKLYTEKANRLRSGYYDLKTANNYHALKQILERRKIRLVCAQYPMQNIGPLEKIFAKETKDGIIFVDNEIVFKEAVTKDGYSEYFADMFGGNFGHCTNKGNELLAGNIAKAILQEVFNKP